MMSNTVFKLEPVLDNPLFGGFAFEESDSPVRTRDLADAFFPVSRQEWNWQMEKLAPIWRPPKVIGRVRPFNDFPCVSMMIPAFSKRAVDGLRDFLEPNGELLPLLSDVGEYFAYNCTKIVEVLDHEKSLALWIHDDQRPSPAVSVRYFSVLPDKLENLTIFRMRELCNCTFVTDTFATRVHSLGLNGFNFVKVWPWPAGVSYATEEAKRRRARGSQVRAATGLKEVKGESLAIDLPLRASRISREEKRAIARFQDELDSQLYTFSEDEVYFGCLEGRKTSKGNTRLVLSCPDGKALVEKLRPWLASLDWPTKPLAYLRHGSWDDKAAKEIPVEI